MRFVYTFLQAAGVFGFAGALWMQWPWVGAAAASVGALTFGVAIELRTNARQPPQQ